MASRRNQMTMDNPFDENLDQMVRKWDAASFALAKSFEPRVEGYARGNAPWTDQTGNARQGLKALAGHEESLRGGRVFIDVFHQVPYGIYLETRWSGRYQIIVPTVKKMGREFMGAARMLLRSLK